MIVNADLVAVPYRNTLKLFLPSENCHFVKSSRLVGRSIQGITRAVLVELFQVNLLICWWNAEIIAEKNSHSVIEILLSEHLAVSN